MKWIVITGDNGSGKTTLLSQKYEQKPSVLKFWIQKEKEIEWQLSQFFCENSPWFDKFSHAICACTPNINNIYCNLVDEQGHLHYGVNEMFARSINHLSECQQNMIWRVGSLLLYFLRLYPDTNETAEFRGTVFWDNFGDGMHPKRQMELPGILSGLFPNIQFVVVTNHVAVIAGMPEDTVFFRADTGHVERIYLTNFANLTPNILLFSPLFGMESVHKGSIGDVRTEDSYDEMTMNDEIRARLEEFEESDMDFPDELFERTEDSYDEMTMSLIRKGRRQWGTALDWLQTRY